MMKKILTITMFLYLIVNSFAQVNVNPDPDGEPWWAGGIPEITEEMQSIIDAIPKLVLTDTSANTPLPNSIDNSQLQFMPPIFLQLWYSCAQAAGITYMYSFEINRLRNANALLAINQYPAQYTYNFLKDYSIPQAGSYPWDG